MSSGEDLFINFTYLEINAPSYSRSGLSLCASQMFRRCKFTCVGYGAIIWRDYWQRVSAEVGGSGLEEKQRGILWM